MMTLQDFFQLGLFSEFVERVRTEANAMGILERVGYPRGGRPLFPASNQDTTPFWQQIGQDIEGGVLPSGRDLQVLVDAARQVYPANELFLRHGRNNRLQARGGRTVSLWIRNWTGPDVGTMLDVARTVARQMNLPADGVSLGIASREGIALNLEGWTPEQASLFRTQLAEHEVLQTRNADPIMAVGQFQDYLISRIFAEGPDQAQFLLTDVPASTSIRDVATAVMQHYAGPPGADGKPNPVEKRQVVIDQRDPSGSQRRLNPDRSLHEEGVGEDQTLAVHPEARAGNLNPVIREVALVRVRNQILDFQATHADFRVTFDPPNAITPSAYVFRFRAPSFGPPPVQGEQPVPIDEHEVFVQLPPDFPMTAPQVFWQTPIFHPNIHPKNGWVCLGDLANNYVPGQDFGELCQKFIEIAEYRNYAVEEGHNLDAQKWATSNEGQLAIENRGGVSLMRMYIQDLLAPRPLFIQRMDV
jgi:hypothetical protein